ncbi:hydroxymethylglutaryl-coa lyase, mitochondrial [Nicotiana attenuata]|nr:hydroxymethylglutaryl-coa lyase, mitochondrial [Nicotiana attenuata]
MLFIEFSLKAFVMRGFLWTWRLSICSGASGSVTTEDVASMLIGLGVKTNVDLRKLVLAGDFILYLQTFFGQPSGSVFALEL